MDPPTTAATFTNRLAPLGMASIRRRRVSSSAARLPVRLSPDEVTLGLGFVGDFTLGSYARASRFFPFNLK